MTRGVAWLAVAAGAAGVAAAIPSHPVLQAVLLMVFVAVGPGSAILCWVTLPPAATVAGVLGGSFAVVAMVTTSMSWLGLWYPLPSCLALSVLTVASGAARLRGREATC